MNLEKYGVGFVATDEGISLAHLEDKSIILPIIKQYAEYLETGSMAIAGSLFLKRYAVLTASASLDYYGLQEKKLDWLGTATFHLNEFTLAIHPTNEIEGSWEEKVFFHHLNSLVEIISKGCKVNKQILWENIAVRLNAVLERNKGSYSEEKIKSLFHSLTQPTPIWFGGLQNPLHKYCQLDNPTRITCCRYYQLDKKEEGMPYCLVCPLKPASL